MGDLNPQTATDAEVDEWLAIHCNEEYDVDDWKPTRDYDQLRLCEEKVQDRWRITTRRKGTGDWEVVGHRGNGPPMSIDWLDELSARARLVMAILQEANRG